MEFSESYCNWLEDSVAELRAKGYAVTPSDVEIAEDGTVYFIGASHGTDEKVTSWKDSKWYMEV